MPLDDSYFCESEVLYFLQGPEDDGTLVVCTYGRGWSGNKFKDAKLLLGERSVLLPVTDAFCPFCWLDLQYFHGCVDSIGAWNRIRGLLTQIHSALERAIGPHLDHPAMAEWLQKYPPPDALRRAGQNRVATFMTRTALRAGNRWAADIFTAVSEQTVVVAGTGAAGIVLARLAAQLAQLRTSRAEVLIRVEALVEAHPLHLVLTSMPAIGVRTEARIVTEIVGKEFATAGHLALIGPAVHHRPHQRRLREIARSGIEILPSGLSQAPAGWRTTLVQPSSRLSKFL